MNDPQLDSCATVNATQDTTGCMGSTIKLASGRYFDLLAPFIDEESMFDISFALGNVCRFAGHTAFYSVAEHCVLASLLVEQDYNDPKLALAVLLHDAAEAFVGDVSRPLKMLLPEYAGIERRIQNAVNDHFLDGIEYDPSLVKRYDNILLKAEKKHFFPDDKVEWTGFENVPNRKVGFAEMLSVHAAGVFYCRYHSLRAELSRQDENAKLRVALADAIRRPMGVHPDSAAGLVTDEEVDAAEARRPRA